MGSFRQVLCLTGLHAARYRRDIRLILLLPYALALSIAMMHTYLRLSQHSGEAFSAAEPFVVAFQNPAFTALGLCGLFLLLCDVGRFDLWTQYGLLRVSRMRWWLSRLLFTAILCIGYYLLLFVLSLAVAAPSAYLENSWSPIALAATRQHGGLSLAFAVYRYSLPWQAGLATWALQSLQAVVLSLILLSVDMLGSGVRRLGVMAAMGVEMVFYCLDLFQVRGINCISIYHQSMLQTHVGIHDRIYSMLYFTAITILLLLI